MRIQTTARLTFQRATYMSDFCLRSYSGFQMSPIIGVRHIAGKANRQRTNGLEIYTNASATYGNDIASHLLQPGSVWHGSQESWHEWPKLAGRFVSEFGMFARSALPCRLKLIVRCLGKGTRTSVRWIVGLMEIRPSVFRNRGPRLALQILSGFEY